MAQALKSDIWGSQQLMNSECRTHNHLTDESKLQGRSRLTEQSIITGCLSASEAPVSSSHPITGRHSGKDSWKNLQLSLSLMGAPGALPSTRKRMRCHRAGGSWLYLGALHFWVPDRQLRVRVFISHLAQRHSLLCSEENPS